MGAGAIIGAAGVAASLAGAGMQYSASQNAASAASNAQNQQMIAQNQAFMARNAAQREQTMEQASVQDRGQEEYLRQQQQMRAGQSEALRQKGEEVNRMNEAEAAIAARTRAQVQQTTEQDLSGQAIENARLASEAERTVAPEQTAPTPQASDPTASPTASNASKSAMADEMAKASKYSENYSRNLARLGSYSAIPAKINTERQNLAMGIMPSASADQLLKSGASARLLPFQTAYQNATNLGQSGIAANTQKVSELMALSKMRQQSNADLATLGQQDTNANIQSGLNYAQARAAGLKAMGAGASAIGQAGITYGASQGGFDEVTSRLGLSDAVTKAQAGAANAYQSGAFSAAPAGTYGPFA